MSRFIDFSKEHSTELEPGKEYLFQIMTAEIRQSKSNPSNEMVTISCAVREKNPLIQNKVVYHNFNIFNANDIARSIGISEFKILLMAIGKFSEKIEDVEKLLPTLRDQYFIGLMKADKTGRIVISKFKESSNKHVPQVNDTTTIPF